MTALSTMLLPEVSAAAALGHRETVRQITMRTIRITLLASILLGSIFYAGAEAWGQALYHSAQVGFYVRVLAPLLPVMYLECVVDGMLKGLGQQVASLRYSVTDSALRIGLILLLVPRMGMKGFLLIMLVSNLMTSLLNVGRLLQVTQVSLRVGRWIAVPFAAAACAALAGQFVCRLLPSAPWGQALGSAAVVAAVYLPLVWLTGSLERDLITAPRRVYAEP